MINVLIVDDRNLTHKLLETYIQPEPDINIVGFANDGQAAIEKVQNLNPDVVLMDVEMPILDGLSATEAIAKNFVATKVLILTVHDNQQHLVKALRIGAKGYLLKTITAQELVNAIRYVNQGYFQLSLELTEKYLQKIVVTQPDPDENVEFRKKLGFLYRSFSKLDSKFKKLENVTKSNVEDKIVDFVEKELAAVKEKDSHVQFKVDRMKYKIERLEQNISYLFRIQIAFTLFSLACLLYSIIVNLKS